MMRHFQCRLQSLIMLSNRGQGPQEIKLRQAQGVLCILETQTSHKNPYKNLCIWIKDPGLILNLQFALKNRINHLLQILPKANMDHQEG